MAAWGKRVHRGEQENLFSLPPPEREHCYTGMAQSRIGNGTSARIFGDGLYEAIAPAVRACDKRLSRLEESQDVLTSKLQGLEARLNKVAESHMVQQSALPKLKQRALQLQGIRARLIKVNKTLEKIYSRVQGSKAKVIEANERRDQQQAQQQQQLLRQEQENSEQLFGQHKNTTLVEEKSSGKDASKETPSNTQETSVDEV